MRSRLPPRSSPCRSRQPESPQPWRRQARSARRRSPPHVCLRRLPQQPPFRVRAFPSSLRRTSQFLPTLFFSEMSWIEMRAQPVRPAALGHLPRRIQKVLAPPEHHHSRRKNRGVPQNTREVRWGQALDVVVECPYQPSERAAVLEGRAKAEDSFNNSARRRVARYWMLFTDAIDLPRVAAVTSID